MEWQPIETAPRDGRHVLTFQEMQEPSEVVMKYDSWCDLWVYADELLSDVDPAPEQPTHWMPLPAPPEDGEQ